MWRVASTSAVHEIEAHGGRLARRRKCNFGYEIGMTVSCDRSPVPPTMRQTWLGGGRIKRRTTETPLTMCVRYLRGKPARLDCGQNRAVSRVCDGGNDDYEKREK
jgi:hypothetical protein